MTELIIQPSFSDTCLYEADPTGVHGGLYYLVIGRSPGIRWRTLEQFNFTTLPDGMELQSAVASLYYWAVWGSDPVGRTYDLLELTQKGWAEVWAAWTPYNVINSTIYYWTTPGGDYTTLNQSSLVVPVSFGWLSWDVLEMVKHCRDEHGKILDYIVKDHTEDADPGMFLYSNNYETDPSLKPKLVLNYSVPSVKPYSYIF